MVSNVLELEPDDLVRQLQQLRENSAADPEYQGLRKQLPADWPI